ncbi:hypothetical protein [Lyngbya confervoides]|uniref:Uncharacterized protein n=1 Tax=Lyngbya confervoides BDU141951 TaxID=1574623 RepID=A0ABD4T7S9_9CYAN|nr:hypothetical protein [Lyngbya confervoides]MCM1984842.1 hypothetical protein [Lyngbya confervoides BDU141951]
MMITWPGIILALSLALIHGFASQLPSERFISRHRWVSFAGGVSLGYVFLEIFPELSHAQETLVHSKLSAIAYLENHIYLLALLGLVIFYGLDKIALKLADPAVPEPTAFFWIHLLSFALINGILGYLLQDLSNHSLFSCLLLFIALGLHLFVIDEHLREHHRVPYDGIGRWVLAAAVVVGMALGRATDLNEAAIAIIWSFLAGSIILQVLKRELPPERETYFPAFVLGTGLFALLLNLQ